MNEKNERPDKSGLLQKAKTYLDRRAERAFFKDGRQVEGSPELRWDFSSVDAGKQVHRRYDSGHKDTAYLTLEDQDQLAFVEENAKFDPDEGHQLQGGEELGYSVHTHDLRRDGLAECYATMREGIEAAEKWALDVGIAAHHEKQQQREAARRPVEITITNEQRDFNRSLFGATEKNERPDRLQTGDGQKSEDPKTAGEPPTLSGYKAYLENRQSPDLSPNERYNPMRFFEPNRAIEHYVELDRIERDLDLRTNGDRYEKGDADTYLEDHPELHEKIYTREGYDRLASFEENARMTFDYERKQINGKHQAHGKQEIEAATERRQATPDNEQTRDQSAFWARHEIASDYLGKHETNQYIFDQQLSTETERIVESERQRAAQEYLTQSEEPARRGMFSLFRSIRSGRESPDFDLDR